MRLILTASADTTIYKRYPTTNAGLDEIIEVGKVARPEDLGDAYTSSSARILINFSLPTSGSIPDTASFYLNLKIANAEKMPYSQQLDIYEISGSWTEGSGYLYQQNVIGASNRNYEYWVATSPSSGYVASSSFKPTIKNAIDGATWSGSNAATSASWNTLGGDYYASPSASIVLNEYPMQDLRIDVSNIMQDVLVNNRDFKGFIVKFPATSETSATNQGIIKFFSKQTHTIHAPILEAAWDTATFSTGSLKAIPSTTDIEVVPKNAKETYIRNTKEKIRFVVRDKYPRKNFDSTLRYASRYYLPTSSYFSVVDRQAGTTIYAADSFAKLSCDATGSYFVLDTSPLYKNRYYAVNLEINNGSEDTTTIPEIFTFLVK